MTLEDVQSSLRGFVLAHKGLKLLKEWNSIVRLHENPEDGKVKLVSGGGSGHEPAHVGYVGAGMLSGAVCGPVFGSPSVEAIVGSLQKVINPDGVAIFIVMNYVGDRLNFGAAMELARRSYGYRNVRWLVVGEDCSAVKEQPVGRRGLAGIVLVHKILGAMADKGKPIDEICEFGEELVAKENLATIGFTFDLEDGKLKNIEIGKGINGEPGVVNMQACDDFTQIIDFITGKLVASVPEKSNVVLLVNNLGGTSELLMDVFFKVFMDKIDTVYTVERSYCGAFLTSKNQAGISVTVLNMKCSRGDLLEYLDHKVDIASMLFKSPSGSTSRFPLEDSIQIPVGKSNALQLSSMKQSGGSKYTDYGSSLTTAIIQSVCDILIRNNLNLNQMDIEAGDGDTGTNMEKAAQDIKEHLKAKKLNINNPGSLLQQIGLLLLKNMGGTSGALYCLFFQGAASGFVDAVVPDEPIGIQHWSQALKNGNAKIVEYAFTQVGHRSMLDALNGGEERLQRAITENASIIESAKSFAEGCKEAAKGTQQMSPKCGRAASSNRKPKNHPDPGAHAVSLWARAIYSACEEVGDAYAL